MRAAINRHDLTRLDAIRLFRVARLFAEVLDFVYIYIDLAAAQRAEFA